MTMKGKKLPIAICVYKDANNNNFYICIFHFFFEYNLYKNFPIFECNCIRCEQKAARKILYYASLTSPSHTHIKMPTS